GGIITYEISNSTETHINVSLIQRHTWLETYESPFNNIKYKCNDEKISMGDLVGIGNITGQVDYSNWYYWEEFIATAAVPCQSYMTDDHGYYSTGDGITDILLPINIKFIAKFRPDMMEVPVLFEINTNQRSDGK
ncbi:unnamed protein product, partial [Didymodactylos carnosus]